MTSQLVQLGQLVIAAACFGAVAFVVARSALAAASIVLATFVLFDATAPPLLDVVVQFGSLSVYPRDVVAFALLSVGSWRLFTGGVNGPARLPLAVLLALFTANLAWGIAVFGVEHATNSARLWLAIVSGLVYAATVRSWDRRLTTAFVVAGVFLALLSIVRVLQNGLYSATTFIDVGGESVDARPVLALGVLVMLNALIMVLGRGTITMRAVGIALLLMIGIVLLQHRTLWIAATVCAVLGLFYAAARYRPSNERLVYLLTGVTLLAVPTVLFAVSQVGAYQESVRSATGSSSTFTWRLEAWATLLEKHSSAFDLAFGTPTGSSREIVVDGWKTNLSAHNLYVEAVLQYGLIGFVCLGALALIAFRFRDVTASQLGLTSPAVVILIASVLMVAVTHSPGQLHALLLGVLVSSACFQPRAVPSARRVELSRRMLVPTR
jgi:hypothetical protein